MRSFGNIIIAFSAIGFVVLCNVNKLQVGLLEKKIFPNKKNQMYFKKKNSYKGDYIIE